MKTTTFDVIDVVGTSFSGSDATNAPAAVMKIGIASVQAGAMFFVRHDDETFMVLLDESHLDWLAHRVADHIADAGKAIGANAFEKGTLQ